MLLEITSIFCVGIISTVFLAYVLIPAFYLVYPHKFIAIMYDYKENPFKDKLNELEIFGLSPMTSRSFHMKSEFDGTQIGIWQILPYEKEVTGDVLLNEQFEKKLNDGSPIFIYLHGVSGNRAMNYRVGVYKLLSGLGYHVLTLDYRGYGDSLGKPKGEYDVVSDAISLIRYARKCAPNSNLFIWGHSMGSGIACSAYRNLQNNGFGSFIQGIIIDAGYTRLSLVVYQDKRLKLFRPKIIMRKIVNSILQSADIEYHSIENLRNASVPISIIHSEDDSRVPFTIGKQLHEELKYDVKDVTFTNLGRNGYGHIHNYTFPEIVEIVRDLVQKANNPNNFKVDTEH